MCIEKIRVSICRWWLGLSEMMANTYRIIFCMIFTFAIGVMSLYVENSIDPLFQMDFNGIIERHRSLPLLLSLVFIILFMFSVILTSTLKERITLEETNAKLANMNEGLAKCNLETNEANQKLEESQRLLDEANKELKRISSYDSLTGLHSRYYFDESIPRIEAEAKRYNLFAWAIMADLDGFKAINDTFGHEAGDTVLRFASKKMKEMIREADNCCCRIGGDEIAIIGNDQSPDAIRKMVLRVVADMKNWSIMIKGVEIRINISIGYSVKKIADGETLASIIAEADAYMYKHKKGEPR